MPNSLDGKYNALNVAAYIIDKFKKKGASLDHLKLQKLLYFIAVKWIGKFAEYPYEQPTEMWKLGPVIREVYGEYRSNGSGDITKPATTLIFNNGKIKFEEASLPNFSAEESDLVDNVIFQYGPLNSFELVDLTHTHTPWANNEEAIKENSEKLFYSYEDFVDIIDQL